MEYKYGTVFREVMTTGRLEVCEILENFLGKTPKTQPFAPLNVILNMTYQVVKDSLDPKLIHPCPYYGSIAINNISMQNTKFFSIFPSGEYRLTILVSNDEDPKIMELRVWHTVKSEIITSF
ncbi:unnamed protein product [Diamesa hyperborea]